MFRLLGSLGVPGERYAPAVAVAAQCFLASMQTRCLKTDAPWTEEEFDPNDPRILHYSYWRRCPKDFLPAWVAPHPTRGWICLACDVHAQVGHCTSERHLQRVVKSQAEPDWFEWFLEEKGNLELANMNPRVGSLLYITLAQPQAHC